MSVVLSTKDVGPWRKQLTVEVPAPAVEAETQRVVREFGQRVRLPGFRRGKVPAEMVRRRFAKDIEREVIDRLVPRYWRQAQAESEIEPLLPPSVEEVGDLEPGGPLTFVATVETRPRVELGNIHDFQLPDPQIEPGELDVDKALDDLRMRFGEWVPVERPAARGDLVNVQITETTDAPAGPDSGGSADGAEGGAAAAPPPNTAMEAAANPVEFEVGDERVWDELSLAVSGLATGQESAFTREAQPPPPSPDTGGGPAPGEPGGREADGAATGARPRRFKVQVNAVKERELPALDDELAARVNPELGGLAELREMVARRLREARIEERYEQRQRALLEQLRERHPMELPQGVVEREVENLTADYAETFARRGVRPEQAGVDWQRVREEMRPHAERRVHSRLLLDAVADAEPVEVTDEEFERALAALARAQKTTTPALRKALHENGRLETLREQLRREKTIRHLLGEPDPAQAAHAAHAASTAADAPDTTPAHPEAGADRAEPAGS
ncbi:MAG TPA: trigger factor [Thermoanaerobaculia bacterium]|jgi:trigger factor|nr:trigger factor [Thermoanaerobaculia bacterium]